MSQTEIVRCSKCFNEFDAHVEDLGTYYCSTCHKPRIEEIDPAQLRGMMLKIYMDAKHRLDTFKKNNQTNQTQDNP